MNKAIVVVLSLRLVAVKFGKFKNLFLSLHVMFWSYKKTCQKGRSLRSALTDMAYY